MRRIENVIVLREDGPHLRSDRRHGIYGEDVPSCSSLLGEQIGGPGRHCLHSQSVLPDAPSAKT